MAYFEWADDMAIDDGGAIDQDHRLLVDLVNELHTATSRGMGRQVVGSILRRAIDSTREHLRREELLLEQKGFPDLLPHKQGHEEFMQRLYELQRQHDAGHITVAAQLSALLRDWLSIHIRRNDKELRKFEQRMRRQSQRASRPLLPGASPKG